MATELVCVGTLGKPHGLRGDLTVFVRTDEPERRFAPGAEVVLGDRPARVRGSRWHSGVLLVALEGVSDRTAAESLRGLDVWARVEVDESPAGEGEFYDRQLVGLTVQDASGAAVGRVVRVLHGPAQDLLVVDVAGDERLVPFVEALVPSVDLDAGVVRVADVGGLLFEVEDAGEADEPAGAAE